MGGAHITVSADTEEECEQLFEEKIEEAREKGLTDIRSSQYPRLGLDGRWHGYLEIHS